MPMHPHDFILIPAIGSIEPGRMTTPGPEPTYGELKKAISKYFDEPFEHTYVLQDGQRRDMFVGETSSIDGRHIRNIRATEIYRNNTLTNMPGTDPESLPAISGPAVLFMSRVWF